MRRERPRLGVLLLGLERHRAGSPARGRLRGGLALGLRGGRLPVPVLTLRRLPLGGRRALPLGLEHHRARFLGGRGLLGRGLGLQRHRAGFPGRRGLPRCGLLPRLLLAGLLLGGRHLRRLPLRGMRCSGRHRRRGRHRLLVCAGVVGSALRLRLGLRLLRAGHRASSWWGVGRSAGAAGGIGAAGCCPYG